MLRRPVHVTVLLVVLALWGPPAVRAQEVAPDRPRVSISARTIPLRLVQIEAGVEYARTSLAGADPERRLGTDILWRGGLTDRLEFRLGVEPIVHLTNDVDETGFGDIALAVKYRVLDAAEPPWRPTIALLPFVKIPTASDPIGSERVDFGLALLATRELPWNLTADFNAGVAAVGQRSPEGFLVQAFTSLAVSRKLTDRLSAFVELFFRTREERGGRNALGADAGAIYLLTPRIALDAAAEAGVLGDGNDYAFRGGISMLFGR
jgi:Putative MetA-pathway of phenol degradation